MATHSGTLAWEIPWTEEPGGLQATESDMTEWLSTNSIYSIQITDAAYHFSETNVLVKASCNPHPSEVPTLMNLNLIYEL